METFRFFALWVGRFTTLVSQLGPQWLCSSSARALAEHLSALLTDLLRSFPPGSLSIYSLLTFCNEDSWLYSLASFSILFSHFFASLAQLVIDYERLHEISNSLYGLRHYLDTTLGPWRWAGIDYPLGPRLSDDLC